jgi:hypothetical protein
VRAWTAPASARSGTRARTGRVRRAAAVRGRPRAPGCSSASPYSPPWFSRRRSRRRPSGAGRPTVPVRAPRRGGTPDGGRICPPRSWSAAAAQAPGDLPRRAGAGGRVAAEGGAAADGGGRCRWLPPRCKRWWGQRGCGCGQRGDAGEVCDRGRMSPASGTRRPCASAGATPRWPKPAHRKFKQRSQTTRTPAPPSFRLRTPPSRRSC